RPRRRTARRRTARPARAQLVGHPAHPHGRSTPRLMRTFAVIQDAPTVDLPERKLHEECGVFGIAGDAGATDLAQLALVTMQHRGPESAGIVTTDGRGGMFHHRGMGLVSEALTPAALAPLRAGRSAVGHVRYSTTGSSTLANAQPLV